MAKRNFITRLIFSSLDKARVPLSMRDRERAIIEICEMNPHRIPHELKDCSDGELYNLYAIELNEEFVADCNQDRFR